MGQLLGCPGYWKATFAVILTVADAHSDAELTGSRAGFTV
jgi:hypothetical protein